jgi:hypothetical protein
LRSVEAAKVSIAVTDERDIQVIESFHACEWAANEVFALMVRWNGLIPVVLEIHVLSCGYLGIVEKFSSSLNVCCQRGSENKVGGLG